MFHFPGCPPMRLWIHLMVTGHCPGRVPPFGYPGINAYLQLPQAFRSLSRPSSAISALASTLRSYSLDLASGLHSVPKTIETELRPPDFFAPQLPLPVPPFRFRCFALSFLPCAVFKVRKVPFGTLLWSCIGPGGLKWTRTTDLSLIRRVL